MELLFDGTFTGWRHQARAALEGEHAPPTVYWRELRSAQPELALGDTPAPPPAPTRPSRPTALRVPREFLTLAEEVASHADPTRWALLYRVLWRLTHGEPHLLEVMIDADIATLHAMAKTVRREIHKMRAFVRFREVATDRGSWFVAWFEPEHPVVEANAPFFRDRFAGLRWSILTPDRCVHWDPETGALAFTAGVSRDAAPAEDATEELWRTYYAHIFNPARLKLGAMTNEMPRRYWSNLPEAELIPALVAQARPRAEQMVERNAADVAAAARFGRPGIPETSDLATLRAAAATCQACPLWRQATCTVFGLGPARARIVVVGEQPGDQEDRAGQPFVGPAGLLLDRALVAAAIDRAELYLTNAVKHFKWTPQGRRRLHQRPNAREVAACRPWLEAELRAIGPQLIVCLGVTAAESVLGRSVRVLSERGQRFATEFGAPALVTVHPSSLLRLPADADAAAEFDRFVADLRQMRA